MMHGVLPIFKMQCIAYCPVYVDPVFYHKMPDCWLTLAVKKRDTLIFKAELHIMPTLEAPCRLSKSMLWRLQADYYETKGPDAWASGAVPFRISSNPFIAHAYAQMLYGFWQDSGKEETLTVIELGGGSGRFGFLLARALQALHAENFKFRCIITDAAQSNVRAWADHPEFAPLVADGLVDFAVLDAAHPVDAVLLRDGCPLTEVVKTGPIALIANYLLDVLVHDAFRVENNTLHEVLVGIDIENETTDLTDPAALLPKLSFRQLKTPLSLPYYNDPILDGILENCRHDLKGATFLLPIVGLQMLETFRQIGDGNLLLLASDKARIDTEQLNGRDGLSLVLNGSYATTVNLNAYAQWAEAMGGICLSRMPRYTRFDTYLFAIGSERTFVETCRAFHREAENFGVADYSALATGVQRNQGALDLRALLAAIRLGQYDPELVARLETPLCEFASKADAEDRAALADALEKAWANHFFIPGGRDVAFTLGRLFRRLGAPARALDFYRASVTQYGPTMGTWRNMGRCCEDLGDKPQAIKCYKNAIALGGDDTCRRRLERLNAHQQAK
jgi:tetratricopeptide (TPR) repeat protein